MKATRSIFFSIVRLTCFSIVASSFLFVNNSDANAEVVGIRMKHILDNHLLFKQNLEGLKAEFEKVTKDLDAERKAILQQAEGMKNFKPGSREHDDLTERMTRLQAEWTLKANKAKRDFRTREATMLYNVYVEIQTEIKNFAVTNKIDMVVQFSNDVPEASKPQRIMAKLTEPIVFVNQQKDVTDYILKALNRGAQAPRVGARPAGPAGVRPRQK